MATAPIEAVISLSKIGSHLMPPEVDFHRPPEAVPTNIISGFEFTTSIDVTRPLIPPGPIFLGAIFLTKSMENSCENKENEIIVNRIVKIFFMSTSLIDVLLIKGTGSHF
jgi:hypothetical protein